MATQGGGGGRAIFFRAEGESPTARDALIYPSRYETNDVGKWCEGEVRPGVAIRRGMVCIDIDGGGRALVERLASVARDVASQEHDRAGERDKQGWRDVLTALHLACRVADMRTILDEARVRDGVGKQTPSEAMRETVAVSEELRKILGERGRCRIFSDVH